jgi:NADH-quinone oxidoreductase subunit H
MDQLMNFAWKFMLPMALLNIVVAGIWRLMPTGVTRWFVIAALIVASFLVLARVLRRGNLPQARVYRFAD